MAQVCTFCGKPTVIIRGGKWACTACGKALAPQTRAKGHVSNANRKLCVVCNADITFAPRDRRADGSLVCMDCANFTKMEATWSETEIPAAESATRTSEATQTHSAADWFTMTPAKWIAIGVASAVVIIIVALVILLHPTWERAHHDELVAMRDEAEQLMASGKPKESYRQYQRLFDFIGQRKITDPYIRDEVDAARVAMDAAYARARPIIDKEDADARAEARQQELARQQREAEEQARRVQAEAEAQRQAEARDAAEHQRKEQERLAAEERVLRVKRELALQQLRKTQQFREIQSKASQIVSSLQTDLLVEDSAYRSISHRAEASCQMLALYVKLQGLLENHDVSIDVGRTLAALEADLVGEDSAVRATYKRDEAFLKLLGVWCNLLDKNSPGLASEFVKEQREIQTEIAGDDSAPRAISAYTRGITHVLGKIASARGKAAQVQQVQMKLERENIGEDSAYRAAMRNAEANMNLVLVLVDHDQDPTVRRIRSEVVTATLSDDSALRAQSEYRQGLVDGLKWLIDHP